MGVIQIKNVRIGEGAPKVIVPLMGKTEQELMTEIIAVKALEPDMIEWRADLLTDVDNLETVQEMLYKISQQLAAIPFLFTFRSHKEGGNKEITDEQYVNLLSSVMDTKLVDLIDIELFFNESKVKSLIKHAQRNQVYTILSNHDFVKTPEKADLLSRLEKMLALGADIPKLAVMPNSTEDVLTLLDVTSTMKSKYKQMSLITMAMGKLGLISRLSGEIFGSAATFAAGKKASAPGQIAISDLKSVLAVIHKQGKNECRIDV